MDLKSLSDEEVAEVVRNSDQEAYAEIVGRYEKKLLRYTNYLVGDQDKAADVVQEALIKGFVNLQGFNTGRKFSSWIYRIAHNQAVDQLRKFKNEVTWVEENGIEDANDDVVVEDWLREELNQEVRGSLNKLPIKYKEPLVLYFFEDKSYEEISDIMRMPVGTVGTRINRGKKMIKKLLKGVKYGN